MAFPLRLGILSTSRPRRRPSRPATRARSRGRFSSSRSPPRWGRCGWTSRRGAARLLNDPLTTASELLCFGVVGAVLISRRRTFPFGWILGLGAAADIALVGIGVPSLALAYDGWRSARRWGVGLGVLQWVPTALQGIINVRFPSGRPSSRLGRWLDRALCFGIPVGLIGNYLGDSVTTDLNGR